MNSSPKLRPGPWDALVVLVVAALAVGCAWTVWGGQDRGTELTAVVSVDGVETERLPLKEADGSEWTISSNGYTLHVILTAEGVWVESADQRQHPAYQKQDNNSLLPPAVPPPIPRVGRQTRRQLPPHPPEIPQPPEHHHAQETQPQQPGQVFIQQEVQRRPGSTQQQRHQQCRQKPQHHPGRPPAAAQGLFPGPAPGHRVGVQLRSRWVAAVKYLAVIIVVAGDDGSAVPAHLPAGLAPLPAGLRRFRPLGPEPHPVYPRLHGPEGGQHPAAVLQPPALGGLILQPLLDGPGIPQLQWPQGPFPVFHTLSSSLSPSATHSFRRLNSCRNSARPRSVMA